MPQNPVFYRLLFSLGGLALFLSLGLMWPYRKRKGLLSRERWFNNLALSFGNALLLRLFIPLGLIEMTLMDELSPLRLLSLSALPPWGQVFLGVLLLDLTLYWQHRLTHQIPILWRLHRVHHSDVEFDTTTGGRFHTLEVFFSFVVKAVIVLLFEIPPLAILIFEILLNFASLFNHTNIHFPSWLEKPLRYVIITPDLHRIHHSTHHDEMNRNFGFSVTLWDRIFQSYVGKNREPQRQMTIGLKQFRSRKEQSLWQLLSQPLKKDS